MTFDWLPLPHLDVVEGLAYGEVVLNALLYAGVAWFVPRFAKGFGEGYQRRR